MTEIAPETVDDAYTESHRQRRASTSPSTAPSSRRRHPREARGQGRRRRQQARPAARVGRDLRPSEATVDARRTRRSRSATSCTPRRTTRRPRSRATSRPTIRPGRRPSSTPTPRTPSSRRTSRCSTRSRARRATRRAPAAPTGTGGELTPTSAPTAAIVEAFSEPILDAEAEDGQLLAADQDRVRLARHPGHVPRAGRWPRSRPRSTAAPTSPRSPATTPRARRPATAATSAGSPRASSTMRLTDGDLRDGGRQDIGRRRGRGRRPVPVQGRRRGDADAGGSPARGDPRDGVLRLVHAEEGRRRRSSASPGDHGTRPRRRRPCSTRSSAEARLRWGLDPAAGLQVIAAERLVATPLEPSRPVLIVPLAMLRPGGARAGCGRRPRGRCRAATGRRRATPLELLAPALSRGPPGGPVRGARRRRRSARSSDADLGAPLYLAPVAPEAAVAGPVGDARGSATGCARPTAARGTASRPTQSLRKHLLEEAYEVYDALEGGATPALAGELGDLLLQIVLHAQLPPRRASSTWPTSRRRSPPRSSAATRTSSATPRRATASRREPPVGADQGRRASARPPTGPGRPPSRRAPSTASAGSLPALAASQEMQERAATSATTGRRSTASSTRSPRRPRSCATPRATDAERREEFGDLLFVLVNVARKHGIDAEAAAARRPTPSSGAASAASSGRRPTSGVALRDLDFAALDDAVGCAPRQRRRSDDMTHRAIGRPASAPTAAARRAAPGQLHARRPEVGRGLVPHPRRRHRRCCARPRSRTASRPTSAARAPAG